MSRKSKIIVCISGIVVITLALLGFTFGFFLTRITGNESSKSIEVVTGDAKIKYTDLSESDIDEIIEPGYEVVKPFTIENIGEGRATYSIYLVNVVNNFNRKEDLTYTLYRTDGIITDTIDKDTDFSEWDTLKENIVYPITSGPIQIKESVEDSASYTYALKITYINHPTESQNIDQGKIFQGSINIRATETETNPFAEGTLAYNIIDDAYSVDTVTPFVEYSQLGITTNTTIPLQEVSLTDEHIISSISDYYGTSYFYRGSVQNNYVLFNDMCWRIVRIEGDGSVKLTLAGTSTNNTCENLSTTGAIIPGDAVVYGFKSIEGKYFPDYENNTQGKLDGYIGLYETLTNWYNTNFDTAEKQSKVKQNTLWCLGGKDDVGYDMTTGDLIDTSLVDRYYYSAGKRFFITKIPSLICGNDEDKIYNVVGTLTMDEVVMAGASELSNTNYYLFEQDNNRNTWLLSSLYNVEAFDLYTDHGVGSHSMLASVATARPVISLINNVKVSDGIGTAKQPYIVE